MSDPYTEKAAANASLEQKVSEVKDIIATTKSAMLTTRTDAGALHSRAMAPVSTEAFNFTFIANSESGKFDDLGHDGAVNISYFDPSSTNWISVSGTGKVVEDKEQIKKVWNPLIKAWFNDLGDGKHTGDYDDPRVAAITVKPSEIRYWYARSKVGQLIEIATAAMSSGTAAPGVLRTLSQQELESLQ